MQKDTRIHRPAGRKHLGLVALIGTVASLAAAFGVLAIGGGGAQSSGAAPSAAQSTAATVAKALPSLPAGPTSVGGVEVAKPTLELGKQPLNVTIQPTFELKNVGSTQARLGQASIEVLEGCCPQQPVMASLSIQPGSTTSIAVPMMMHKGMDGPHLFHITVPILSSATPGESLHLYVRADFG